LYQPEKGLFFLYKAYNNRLIVAHSALTSFSIGRTTCVVAGLGGWQGWIEDSEKEGNLTY